MLALLGVVGTCACGGRTLATVPGGDDAPAAGSGESNLAGGDAGLAGTAVVAARQCEATLEGLAEFQVGPIELDCAQGIRALGGGLYRLVLTSARGDQFTLTLPTIQSGRLASPACATASFALSNGLPAATLRRVPFRFCTCAELPSVARS